MARMLKMENVFPLAWDRVALSIQAAKDGYVITVGGMCLLDR